MVSLKAHPVLTAVAWYLVSPSSGRYHDGVAETSDTQLLKGVLPLLVLGLLRDQESYGYELVTRLRDAGLADITAGTVYPVLSRLEREHHVASRLVPSSSGPARKYYRPTASGERHLTEATAAWNRLATTVRAVVPEADGAAAPPEEAR